MNHIGQFIITVYYKSYLIWTHINKMVRAGFQFRMLLWNSLFKILAQKQGIANSVTFNYMKLKKFRIYNFFQNFLFQEYAFPANISTSDQRCFNVVDQRWKWNKIRRRIFNVAQRWYNVGVRRWNNVETTLIQLYLNFVPTWPQQ